MVGKRQSKDPWIGKKYKRKVNWGKDNSDFQIGEAVKIKIEHKIII